METGVCEYDNVSTEAWLMLLLHSASSSIERHSDWVVNQDAVYSEVTPVEVANDGISPSTSSGGTFHERGEMMLLEWGHGDLNGDVSIQGAPPEEYALLRRHGEYWIPDQMLGESNAHGVMNR